MIWSKMDINQGTLCLAAQPGQLGHASDWIFVPGSRSEKSCIRALKGFKYETVLTIILICTE